MSISRLKPSKEKIIKIAPVSGIIGIGFLSLCIFLVLFSYNDSQHSYSVFNHFISELGHTTYSPFFWAFSLGLIIGGPLLAIFIMGLAYRLNNKTGYWAMRIGIVSSVACFFVGVFPANLALAAHMIAALTFFLGSLIATALFSVAIYIDKENRIPSRYIIPSSAVVIIGTIFLSLPTEAVAEFLKDREAFDRPAFWINPFFEWLVFFSLAIWVVLLSLHLRKTRTV